jgi:regulator of protease activity HflC (stomatin/prohibitin superfamily)
MPSRFANPAATEHIVTAANGWLMLIVNLALLFAGIYFLQPAALHSRAGPPAPDEVWRFCLCGFIILAALISMGRLFTLQPNQGRVLILFGAYKGTVRASGFHWANPFYARRRGNAAAGDASDSGRKGKSTSVNAAGSVLASSGLNALSTKISLRSHNFSSETIKVNDKRGNPVEIAAVIVWRVEDTAQAVFDVEDYRSYVEIQSESAIRSIASHYAYDHGEESAHVQEQEITLRGGADHVAHALKQELQERLLKAGVAVEEARLTHLAYAPEIAPAMLRRQQAEAIIGARRIIVQNAVIMVKTALDELDRKSVVKLDDERKAAMVSNLLVVLCGNSEATPVINTGTLYT